MKENHMDSHRLDTLDTQTSVQKIGHIMRYTPFIKRWKECIFMKGYNVEAGYMGYVDGGYMLFANEEDYKEYFEA